MVQHMKTYDIGVLYIHAVNDQLGRLANIVCGLAKYKHGGSVMQLSSYNIPRCMETIGA